MEGTGGQGDGGSGRQSREAEDEDRGQKTWVTGLRSRSAAGCASTSRVSRAERWPETRGARTRGSLGGRQVPGRAQGLSRSSQQRSEQELRAQRQPQRHARQPRSDGQEAPGLGRSRQPSKRTRTRAPSEALRSVAVAAGLERDRVRGGGLIGAVSAGRGLRGTVSAEQGPDGAVSALWPLAGEDLGGADGERWGGALDCKDGSGWNLWGRPG